MKFFRQTVIAAGMLLILGTASMAMAHHGCHRHNDSCWQDERCYQNQRYSWCEGGVCRFPGSPYRGGDSLFGQILEERTAPAVQPEVLSTSGVITEIDGSSITVKGDYGGDKYNWVTVNLSDSTYILNGRSGSSKDAASLKKGMKVTVYYSAVMTRSLPPQASAYAVVTGAYDEKQGQYMEADRVKLSADGSYMEIYDADRDLVAAISEDACSDYKSIKAGDRILGWYDYITMSIPARTNMKKAVILPQK